LLNFFVYRRAAKVANINQKKLKEESVKENVTSTRNTP